MRYAALAPVLAAALACASAPPPPAAGAIDWDALAAEKVPELVTFPRDGSERVRKLWLVVVDGRGYIRTGQTRWLGDIQRDANVVLRIGGASHALRAAPVSERAVRDRVNRAFRKKYGFQDVLIHPFGAPSAAILELVER